ncbi:unnamed protein product [Trifolium pratense]|uniref:Uncharacterized protein n=1 Tax=Trifolium pratense TaxID=57577 RepID=A0ACB0LSZ3_TRIPR|nr:unnamed protein product [Trifolium pratense]
MEKNSMPLQLMIKPLNDNDAKELVTPSSHPQLSHNASNANSPKYCSTEISFSALGDECDYFDSGDIIYITNGIFSYQRRKLVLRAGKRGKLEKIGEFTMSCVETPNMSEIHWIPDPTNPKKYIQEYVISPHSRIFGLVFSFGYLVVGFWPLFGFKHVI